MILSPRTVNLLGMYPNADQEQMILYLGWSIILITILNLLYNILQLSGDLWNSVATLLKNQALLAERLYQLKKPNAVDPEDSEDDMPSDLEETPDAPKEGYIVSPEDTEPDSSSSEDSNLSKGFDFMQAPLDVAQFLPL